MQPRIETLTERKLIGKRITMSLSNNKTGELWRIFMPRRREISNKLTSEMFSSYTAHWFNHNFTGYLALKPYQERKKGAAMKPPYKPQDYSTVSP